MGRPMLNHPFPLGRALYWQLKDRVVANAFPHTLHSFSRHRRRLHRLPMKRRRDICEGTDLQGHTATHPCVSKKRRHNRQEGSRAFATPFFGWLPDELVLDILAALDSPRSLISWGQTSRRHHELADDPLLWNRLCVSRFGPLLHHQFLASGKSWRWLYRAQAHAAASTGVDVGALVVTIGHHIHVYWGDCVNGVPHGYGLALLLPTPHCHRERGLARVWTDPSGPTATKADAGYEGQWQRGRMWGHGVQTQPDGSRHDGLWVDGRRNGAGMYTRADGFKCDGTWTDNKRVGLGTATWPCGAHYVGQWAEDMRNGRGMQIYSADTCYEGDWADDKRAGRGTITWTEGRYEGDWKGDKRNGWGTCVYASGDRYDGQWKNNERYGHGTYTWPTGQRYQGQYVSGARSGYGECLYADGICHKGYWKNGLGHGHGTVTYPNGDCYAGNFSRDERIGYGVYVWADGMQYRGEWKADKPHGKGLLIKPNGARYQGDWAGDNRHGHGIGVKPDGSRYDGQWHDDERRGTGTWQYADGSSVRGEWRHKSLVSGKVVHHRDGAIVCISDSVCVACAIVAAAQPPPEDTIMAP